MSALSADLGAHLASEITALYTKLGEYVPDDADSKALAAAQKETLEILFKVAQDAALAPSLRVEKKPALSALPKHMLSATPKQKLAPSPRKTMRTIATRRASVVELTMEKEHNEKIMKRIDSQITLNRKRSTESETTQELVSFGSPVRTGSRRIQPLMLPSPAKSRRTLLRNQTATNLMKLNKVDSSKRDTSAAGRDASGPIHKKGGKAIGPNGEVTDQQVTVINPNSHLYWVWNAIILILVLFSSISVPVRLAFDVSASKTLVDFAKFMEICFILDVGLNFFCAYWDPKKCEIVTDIAEIRAHYLRGWFAIDVLSSIPVEFITASSSSSAANDVALLKTLRLLKLFRLVRLLHLKALQDLEYKGYLPPSMVRLFKLVFSFLLITHLVACGYWAVAIQESVGDDGSTLIEDTWLPREKYFNQGLYHQYAEAFYWAMLVFVGSDVSPANTNETTFTATMMLVGIGVFASVIGSASSLLTNLDSTAEQKKTQMDSINHYLTFHAVPKQLRAKIRDYYEYLWTSGQSIHDKNLFDQLPESLNLQLDLSLKRKLLEGVPMFKELRPLSVLGIIRKLTDTIAIPEEVIMRQGEFGDCMYFLKRGKADVYLEISNRPPQHLNTLTDGAVFGEIALVHPEKPRTATVCATSYCELHELKLPDFEELMEVYDDIGIQVLSTADRRLNRTSKQMDKEKDNESKQGESARKESSDTDETADEDGPDSSAATTNRRRGQLAPLSSAAQKRQSVGGVVNLSSNVTRFKTKLLPKKSSVGNMFNALSQHSQKITRNEGRRIGKASDSGGGAQ